VSATRSDGAGPRAGALATSLAPITVALLAIATVIGLLVAQHLKDDPALIQANAVVWSPSSGYFDPRHEVAEVSFVTPYANRLTVSVVSARSGKVVAVLARNYRTHGYRSDFFWHGETSSGTPAPPGDYAVSVRFAGLDRTTRVPSAAFDIRAGS
jgi:hypothetical protein